MPITREWRLLGHDVLLAAGDLTEGLNSTLVRGVTRRPSLSSLQGHQSIAKWAREQDLDVVLTNTATASALARLRDIGVPVVYFCHGLHWNTGSTVGEKIWQVVEKSLLRNTAGVISINSSDKVWFGNRVSKERHLHLRNGVGVPLREYPLASFPDPAVLQVLWAGEFSERKRPHLMLEVVESVVNRGTRCEFVMLGDGPQKDEVEREARRRGLSNVLEFPGRRPIQDWIEGAHVMAHTSMWEGLPRVLLEAYAMGRQSVAFDVKGTRDIPDIVLVPDGDTDALADNLARLALTPPVNPVELDVSWMDSAIVAGKIVEFLVSICSMDSNPNTITGSVFTTDDSR